MTLNFHHIGIAVFSIEQTKLFYCSQGYEATETVYDPVQNVKICFLKKQNEPLIELLEPKDDSSPIWQTLQKSGVTPYHDCYETDCTLEDTMQELRKQRFVVVKNPEVAVAINDRRVCFLYNKNVGLIELLEK